MVWSMLEGRISAIRGVPIETAAVILRDGSLNGWPAD